MTQALTQEQKNVVLHPIGNHAKILAVAGAGKTSTLVYRIKYLVFEKQVNPASIQVLMFNSLARKQFNERIKEANIPPRLQPKVDTFHSFSYNFLQKLIASGSLPGNWDFWIGDKEEKSRITLNKVISSLEKSCVIPIDSVDSDEASQAIQLWKGSLIRPLRAGYQGNEFMPLVYEAYERERKRLHALTYDDFIPIVVWFLENNHALFQQYTGNLQHLIVDEYQDVNYGQQRLIELLAGNRADVMVMGDDDQTIFEWRGARPNYIIREFQSIFDNKPFTQYELRHSFRFGPVIAQCALNSILFNTNRVPKSLVSHNIKKSGNIFLYEQSLNECSNTSKELTNQILVLVKDKKIHPSKIIVLCRMFSQLSSLESELMVRRIPYRIDGQRPFFERSEIKNLLNYVRLVICYHDQLTEKIKPLFLNIANTPNRMLARKDLEHLMSESLHQKITLAEALHNFAYSLKSPLNNRQQERVLDLMSAFESAYKQLNTNPINVLLSQLVSSLNYFDHFDSYYGKGETSFERKSSILNFIEYSEGVALPPLEFLTHISKLDTTLGKPSDEQIVMTTIFKTKGLEYDYVIIPNCNEGYMPSLYATDNRIFDTHGKIKELEPSEAIENERRLFYVALTRAKEAVYIGTGVSGDNFDSQKQSRFIEEIQIEPTVKVMTDLQQTASGQKNAEKNLLSNISKFGGIKSLINILITHYLIQLEDHSLIGKVASIVNLSPETPFRYRFAYPTSQENKLVKKIEPSINPIWDDIDE